MKIPTEKSIIFKRCRWWWLCYGGWNCGVNSIQRIKENEMSCKHVKMFEIRTEGIKCEWKQMFWKANVFHSFFGASIICFTFSEDFSNRNMLSKRAILCKYGKIVEINVRTVQEKNTVSDRMRVFVIGLCICQSFLTFRSFVAFALNR